MTPNRSGATKQISALPEEIKLAARDYATLPDKVLRIELAARFHRFYNSAA